MLRIDPEGPGQHCDTFFVPGGGSRIVQRDDSNGSSSRELGSFDVAKMSEADVAAEIAQRMTRWRRANNRAPPPERAEPPERDTAARPAPSAAAPDARPAIASPKPAGPQLGSPQPGSPKPASP